MRRPLRRLLVAGLAFTAAMAALVLTGARLGTPVFFACAAIGAVSYGSILPLIWHAPPADRRLFFAALGLAVLIRVPLALSRVDAGSDMYRYIWDGRVQVLGYNPYAVLPADPALAFTHADDTTRLMASRNRRTPYPPAAQLFFRAVVSLSDSMWAMKEALIVCDLITIVFVWRWLLATGRSEWLALAYAWNPLVVLEAAFSGHVDVLCAMWTAACACWLARRRRALAAAALALAVASKLLPVVLVPLLWRRIRLRDAAVGAAVGAVLYLPFALGGNPFVELGGIVESIRFNGPLFRAVAALATPRAAAAVAVAVGWLLAVVCRARLDGGDPAAWAWPMAASLVFAPVVYPWYLLSLTPFLLVPATLPLQAWTASILSGYVVWEIARAGGPWLVPWPVLTLEYGTVAAGLVALAVWQRAPLDRAATIDDAPRTSVWPRPPRNPRAG
ncbi:MAG: DUF2029 domain-containing protein [Acidobacteria bacterium]|nr:DUF2029 domain-containing protein [Acidobacteriota bacterium]